jgi:ATP-dependent exoDNAse (exonuclease V) beta subunit
MKCFGRADKRYAELKGPNLDFADLEMFAIRLLQDKDTRKKYQKRFKHILVDEFQDVNDTQGHLISLLFNKEVNNLTIVGDEKQSIYRFRGANVEEFKKALRSAEQTVTLKENFRSTAAILEFINSVFPRFAPLITPPSPIPSTSLETCKVETPMLDEPEDATSDERRVSEANFIAMTVESLEGSTACLFSSLKSSKIYLKALEEGQISYDIVGGCGFLEKEEITDVLNALRLTADEKDIMALLGLARSPYIGLTDEELFMLCRNRPKGEGLYQAIRGHSKGGFLNVIEEASNGLSIAEMIRRYAGDNSTDDIEKLCHMADDAASREKISLKDFVEYLAALKERGAAIPEFPQTVESQAVLMTIHQAKGLEFDNVILCDTIRRNRNDSKKWCFIRGENPGLAFKLRPENNPEADPIETENYTRLFELNEEDNKKERERLLYVAMTRAKKRLIIPLHPGAKQDGEWHKMLLNICHPHGCKRLPASCVAGVSQEHSSRDSRLLPRE